MPKLAKNFEMRTILKHPITILVLLNSIIFHKYWLGISTPPWDFLGGGMVEQYRFYKDGGFFNPPSWYPYAWFGIPEYQMLQDGGWFLPVAVVSNLFGWHPANAARLQAFLVLFGTVGTYYLSRIFISKKWINLLAAVMYSIIPAFYSNAQHYGVVRSAALLPWVLLFIHPKILLASKLRIFLGSVIIFQTIVGSYPGNLIATAYTAALFFLLFGLAGNKHVYSYLFSLSIMILSGTLMGLLRYLPTLGLQNSFPSSVGNQAGITLYNLNYLIFPFVGQTLPWEDLTLRSLYIGSTLLAILFFYQKGIENSTRWIIISVFSIIMMSETVLNTILRQILPLTDISRFAITDWRNSFNLGIVILAALIINRVTVNGINWIKFRFTFLILAAIYLIKNGLTIGQRPLNIIIFTFLFLISFLIIQYQSKFKRNFPKIILLLTFLGGMIFAFQNSFSWMTTVKEQNFNIYNNSFTNVQENTFYPLKYRPKRVSFLAQPLTAENYKTDQRFNRFWLTGGFGAFGYHNIKDIKAYSSLFPRLEKNKDPVVDFLMARSKQLALQNNDNLEKSIEDCTFSIGCPNNLSVSIRQEYFDKQSEKFKISAQSEFIMIQNEMFSPVWRGKVCVKNNCEEVKSFATLDSLRSWNLPKGDYILETFAQTPFDKLRWWLFYLGLTMSILPSFVSYLIIKRSTAV
jgi:hypothetical protein